MLFLNRHERMDACGSLFNVYPRGTRTCVYSEERMSIRYSFLYESGRRFIILTRVLDGKKKRESNHELSSCRSTQLLIYPSGHAAIGLSSMLPREGESTLCFCGVRPTDKSQFYSKVRPLMIRWLCFITMDALPPHLLPTNC